MDYVTSRVPASRDDRQAWAEPGVEDLGGGLYRIPLPLPGDALTAVNVYAMAGDHGVDLIDAGMALTQARERLTEALGQLGSACPTSGTSSSPTFTRTTTRSRLSCGPRCAARSPSAMASAPTWTRSGTSPPAALRSGSSRCSRGWARQSWPRRYTASWIPGSLTPSPSSSGPTGPLASDGALLGLPGRTLRAIHTPGHTTGHVVFHDEAAAVLFEGDHVLPHITPSIGFQPVITRLALDQYLGSLRLMLTLPTRGCCPRTAGPAVHPRAGAPAA